MEMCIRDRLLICLKRWFSGIIESKSKITIWICVVCFPIIKKPPPECIIIIIPYKRWNIVNLSTGPTYQPSHFQPRTAPEGIDVYKRQHHPAVLRLLQMVADNAHKAGIWVGICGELGADLSLTESFIRMGMDELSVSPAMVLPVRQKIRETN